MPLCLDVKGALGTTGRKIERLRKKAQKYTDAIEAIPEVIGHRRALTVLGAKIAKLVSDCPHESPAKTYDGDGGSYYDKPSYWINWHCPDCGKRWTTDQ